MIARHPRPRPFRDVMPAWFLRSMAVAAVALLVIYPIL